MKQIKYIIGAAIAVLLFNSCSDWLDVNPRSEMKESVLFQTEDGYKKSLNGAYILMAQSSLYGKSTTMYIPEMLARNWTIPTLPTDLGYQMANFDYTYSAMESTLASLWLEYYRVIVQLNNILQNLENSNVAFEHNNDALIKGEALGLRAFLHFDILRYFGPVPSENNPSATAIPYVTEMTKDPAKLVSIPYSEVIKHIEADLDAAENLLANDPILFNSNYALNYLPITTPPIPKDNWQRTRQGRFNYYACLGAKARFYQWTGDKAKATLYAKKVIEAINKDNTPKFALTTEATYAMAENSNLVMYSEHLFGVHNPNLQTFVDPMFKGKNASFQQTELYMNTCYENMVNPSDIRYKPVSQPLRYWEEKTYENSHRVNHFKKYTGNDWVSSNNRVPLLRLAEMYLILIEDLPLEEARPYFRTFRMSRAMDASLDGISLSNESERMKRIEKEYRKEFFGEGQMFFFYKRLNYKFYTWPTNYALPVNAYVFPKPKTQLSFE